MDVSDLTRHLRSDQSEARALLPQPLFPPQFLGSSVRTKTYLSASIIILDCICTCSLLEDVRPRKVVHKTSSNLGW